MRGALKSQPKLVLGAVLARCPRASAGHTCATMNWALAFRELGWDVWIVEHVDSHELEPAEGPGLRSPQEEFWTATAHEFGFEGRECLIVNGESESLEAFREFAAEADLFLNYSGQFKRLDLLGPRVRKAYLDVDPGFTQLWVETCGSDMNFEGHDVFLTVGLNLNGPTAKLPLMGREWIPTVPPSAYRTWRQMLGPAGSGAGVAKDAWTTIGHWYGYSDLVWEGRTYGGKRDSLLAMLDLPRLAADQAFAIATDLQREWGDYDEFEAAGWRFLSSAEVCRDVPSYLRFIAESRGEIGIAKAGYVISRGGWMSDRSVVYLALGRPVLLQETGWSEVLTPTAGLWPFRNAAEAAEQIRRVEADYAAQTVAASRLAETVFSPEGVLNPLLARIL